MMEEIPYKKGDFIGQTYEVYGVLGIGGFGVVYLVYSHKANSVCALKTFRDEYLKDAEMRTRFRKEAEAWVNLERHPYIVRAPLVDEIAGRHYIVMEYIAPDEQGLNSLEGYIECEPPDLAQSLRWSIQFCHGMEYAYSRGIRCHRDIKPSNIMISWDKIIKISDFGLADVLSTGRETPEIKLSIQHGRVGLSGQTMVGAGFGTPTHMPPEQFTDIASCDERSDIYAFGVVLYQMVAHGQLPFLAPFPRDNSREEITRFWWEMHRLHSQFPVPKLDSPLFLIIQRCLEKEPSKRYQTFNEMRKDLEPLLWQKTGEVINIPEQKEFQAWEWSNKGMSLVRLNRFEEALRSLEKAIEIDPLVANIWNNKGICLGNMSHLDEALKCLDMAIEIDPLSAYAWNNKGFWLGNMGRFDEALKCLDKAIQINPLYADAWNTRGTTLFNMGHIDEALISHKKAVEIDSRHGYAWNNMGLTLYGMGRLNEALKCYDKAIEIDPWNANAWYNKGMAMFSMDRFDEAIKHLDKAIEIDPKHVNALNAKGIALYCIGRLDEALGCYDKAIEIEPQNAEVWFSKAISEDKLYKMQDAVRSYKNFIALASMKYVASNKYCLEPAQHAELNERLIERACKRLLELEGR